MEAPAQAVEGTGLVRGIGCAAAVAIAALTTSPALAASAEPGLEPTAVLFRNVTLIPMTSEHIEPGCDVLVQGGRIARIDTAGSIRPPQGARQVRGRGKFLFPGLAEMHAHVPGRREEQFAEDVLLLYAAHGVTTIRGMLGEPWHLELRAQLERGDLIGPRLYTAGPSFNGRSTPGSARSTISTATCRRSSSPAACKGPWKRESSASV
jgi:hypothetical protein